VGRRRAALQRRRGLPRRAQRGRAA
jgi:hypothetical protein